MKQFRFLPLFLLCAAPTSMLATAARAADAPVQMPAAKTHAIRDASDARTIEVVTDCDETVEQFFARQKLSLVDNANTDGKFWSVDQIVNGEASKFFVSYPLQNDQGFRTYRYGDYYNLEKPAPAVAALFADTKLNWKNVLLILAPATEDEKTANELNKPARLVGFVSIPSRDNWRPEMDADALKYSGEATK